MRLRAAFVVLIAATPVVAACGSDSTHASDARTPPALRTLPTGPTTVWAVGDGADGGPAGTALAAMLRRQRPRLFLYLGDVYDAGTRDEFAAHYDTEYGAFARRTAPTPGNHEWAARSQGYRPYWRTRLGGSIPDYFSLRIAGWQVLSLNSEAPHSARSPQVRWLHHVLRGGGTCRIAFFHRPRFSAGAHGDQADLAPLWDALRGHAALVLNGHDHTSQRLKPIRGSTEIVAGGGGHAPYPIRLPDRRLAYATTGAPQALRLRLRSGSATVSFVGVDGQTRDRAVVPCRQR